MTFAKEEDDLTTVQDDFLQEKETETEAAKEETFKQILEKHPAIIDQINALTMMDNPCLVIDYDYLIDNPEYFSLVEKDFVKNVKLLGGAALQIYMEHHANDKLYFMTRVRISDPLLIRPLRSISTSNINKGVIVSTGTINSVSEKKSAIIEPVAICSNCGVEGVGRGGASVLTAVKQEHTR